jgi:hypothetical protein
MKNSWHFKLLFFLVLGSCINGEQTYKVDYTDLLNGGNSKVWELAQEGAVNPSVGKQNWADVVFVFDESGKVLVGSLEDLAQHKFDAGVYQYKAQKQELQMQINGETLLFGLSIDNHEGLWLKTKKGKNINKFLHLVPLTEPQTP